MINVKNILLVAILSSVAAIAAAQPVPAAVAAPATKPATMPASGPTTKPVNNDPPKVQALIVTGLPGSNIYARRYQDWAKRFHAYLVNTAKVPAKDIQVLSGDKDFKETFVTGKATTESICAAIDKLAGTLNPQDQFILILMGHGNNTDSTPAMVLEGPDLTPEKLAKSLSQIPATNQVVLNFTAAGGDFLKPLAVKGRVNISATSPGECTEPAYAEFFLRGLESGRADGEGGAKDSVVSLLEAYNWATYQLAMWISRQTLVKDAPGGWNVVGKESVEIFKKLYVGGEDEVGARPMAASSDAAAADPVVELVPPKDITAIKAWGERRIVDEHAVIEDQGKESAEAALGGEKGYTPVTGAKDGDEGSAAAKTVLGKPGR